MKIYITNTGNLKHIEYIIKNGLGIMYLANSWKYPKKHVDWILDNGAYHYWLNNLDFNHKKFEEALIKTSLVHSPDFIVCPDIVAGGDKSLLFSLDYMDKIPSGYNVYLPVQDGMKYTDVNDICDVFDGLFVGGTLKWKLNTANQWIKLAHDHNLKCHIGRVGTYKRMCWANSINADSIDSSTFVQVKNGFKRIESYKTQTFLSTY